MRRCISMCPVKTYEAVNSLQPQMAFALCGCRNKYLLGFIGGGNDSVRCWHLSCARTGLVEGNFVSGVTGRNFRVCNYFARSIEDESDAVHCANCIERSIYLWGPQ